MEIERPDSFEHYDINDPLDVAKIIQDEVFFLSDEQIKQEFVMDNLYILNQQWQYRDKLIEVTADKVIGPSDDDCEGLDCMYFDRAVGYSFGFSFLRHELDFGDDLYLTLLVTEIKTVRDGPFQSKTTKRQFHAPVIDNPTFRLLEAS